MATSKGLLSYNIKDVTIVTFQESSILDTLQIEQIGASLYELVDERNSRKLVLDFTKVQFLSSSALGVLITLRKKSDAIKGRLILAGLRKEIRKVFTISRLDKLFEFAEDEQAALALFGLTSAG